MGGILSSLGSMGSWASTAAQLANTGLSIYGAIKGKDAPGWVGPASAATGMIAQSLQQPTSNTPPVWGQGLTAGATDLGDAMPWKTSAPLEAPAAPYNWLDSIRTEPTLEETGWHPPLQLPAKYGGPTGVTVDKEPTSFWDKLKAEIFSKDTMKAVGAGLSSTSGILNSALQAEAARSNPVWMQRYPESRAVQLIPQTGQEAAITQGLALIEPRPSMLGLFV